MKILQVNCVYGHGSTGKITRDIHHALLARGFSPWSAMAAARRRQKTMYIEPVMTLQVKQTT